MPDTATDRPAPVFIALPKVCGIIGLAMGLVWWLWPSPIDPLSMGLSRTTLFSRHLHSSPVRPVIIDVTHMRSPNDTSSQAGSLSPWQLLLEKITAQSPRMIALADVHHPILPMLRDLKIVAPDPEQATLFMPAEEINPSLLFSPWATADSHVIGLRSATAELFFNVHLLGGEQTATPFTGPANTAGPSFQNEAYPVPSFAFALASRFPAGDVDDTDVLPDERKGPSSNSSFRVSRHNRFAIQGGHRLFFEDYPAAAIIEERIQEGVMQNRLVLLGMRSTARTPVDTASQPFRTRTEVTAFNVWALLNKQIVHRPQWLFVFELGLILGLSICPAYFQRRFSLKGMWLANGVSALTLIAGSIFFWHLSGFMLQTGFALLGVILSGGVVTALAVIQPSVSYRAVSSDASRPGRRDAAGQDLKTDPAAEDDSLEGRSSSISTPAVDMPSTPLPSLRPIQKKSGSVDKIGRYEVLRCLGKGAMGEVFLGRDPNINRLTAIKTLRFEENFAEDEIADIKEKFFREAESAGTLSHTNIVTIYDAGEDRDQAYIAMEYLEGITLLRFTRKKRLLPVHKIIAYGVQIAEALDYAHRQGIVHRDIKPANIMVSKNGEIKITDFGIARITSSSHTQTGVVKGTPYYMSPEQFSGAKVDGRSDIFSLGTMLFQLLTGILPFFSESPAVLMNQIMNFPHPNPRAINPRVLPAIIPIVDKALEKDPLKRYQHADQMGADFTYLKRRIDSYLKRKSRVN